MIACPSCGCHARSSETACPECGAALRRPDGSVPRTAAAVLMWRSLALLLAVISAGCATPEPFDPLSECPKLTVCGQCASRGACVWCGDPNDGGKGECVATGRRECSAPSALSKTPDQCGPAPGGAPAATALPSAPENATETEKRIGTEKYQAIRRALTRAFPAANIDDEVIGLVADALSGPRPPPRSAAESPEKEPIVRTVREKDHPLYVGHAVHHRHKSMGPSPRPMESRFTKALPLVRVRLPEKLTAETTVIQTEIGDVDLVRDHLLGSIDLIASKYGDVAHLGFRPGRVDLLTPARSVGARFGAISVYLGYRAAGDKAPAFYMLEAGTATGDAKMIYFSPSMAPITNVTSYYQPTPFVTMQNTYSGGVTMSPAPREDEPLSLLVESRTPGDPDPYLTVLVSYVRSPTIELPMPVELIVNAAARVAAIARAMGVSSSEPLQDVLADLAKSFYWMDGPRYAEPPAVPGATPTAP
jgi:hypothetical protein